jgi:hypothetical protein
MPQPPSLRNYPNIISGVVSNKNDKEFSLARVTALDDCDLKKQIQV